MSEFPIAAPLKAPSDSEKRMENAAESANAEKGESAQSASAPDTTLRGLKAQAENQAIREVLARTGWNRKRAAQLLRISYRGLLYKIQQYNITH